MTDPDRTVTARGRRRVDRPLPADAPRRHARRAAVALLAAGLGGCAAEIPDGADGIRQAALPSTSEMMAWIETIHAQGVRRPGYPADRWAEEWSRDRFVELGLQDVTLDPVTVRRWEPTGWSLSVWNVDSPEAPESIPCWPVPMSAATAPGGLEADLALAAPADAATVELSGRIAVVENRFIALPQSQARGYARWEHDPTGEFETLTQTIPFSWRFQRVMAPEIEAGAVGFVGILRGLPWETDRYFVPYDAEERPIPGVWLSENHGDRLLEILQRGPARARLELRRELVDATSHNVTGTLPGASDEWVIIGSHHDGPWSSAVEDASGMALVLAQASYWAQVPRGDRPHNLLFLLNGGHMSGGAGLRHFVDTHREFLERETLVEIHLEHAAREARGEDGRLVPTDAPEVRWWFTSFVTPLEEAVADAICAEGLERSLMMPVEGFPAGSEHPPTDGAFFHPWTPIVDFLTAPMYLFDPADTPEMVHEDSLLPLTRATIRIVEALRDRTAADLRAETYEPPRSSPIPPCPTPDVDRTPG